jgi:hypothetical protein
MLAVIFDGIDCNGVPAYVWPSFPRKRRRFTTANAGQSIFKDASEQNGFSLSRE